MNERDIIAQCDAMKGACAVLKSRITSLGLTAPTAPASKFGECIAELEGLQNYHAILSGVLANANPALSAPAPVSSQPAAQLPPITLSKEQITFLNWTEKVSLAQGRLTNERALELVKSRQEKALTLTQKCIAARAKRAKQ